MAERLSRAEKIRRYVTEVAAEIEAAPSGSLVIDYGPDGELTIKRSRVDRLREPRAPTCVMD